MRTFKLLVSYSTKYLAVWCVIGTCVAGLTGLEFLYWKAQGRDLWSGPITESIVRDCSTNRRGQPIAMIIGQRTRFADPPSLEVMVNGGTHPPRQIHFDRSITPFRVALSEHDKIAILTVGGGIYLGSLDHATSPMLERLGSRTLKPTLGDLEFSVDGRYLAVHSENMPVVWDIDNKKQISASWPEARSRFLCFLQDSGRILEATSTHLQVRDLLTGSILKTIPTDFAPSAARVSPNGEMALLCSSANKVRMWNLAHGMELWQANSCSARGIHLATNDHLSLYFASPNDIVCCDAITGERRIVAVSSANAIHGMMLINDEGLLSWDIRGVFHETNLQDLRRGR